MTTHKAKYSTKAQRVSIMKAIQYNTDRKRDLALTISNRRTDSLTKLYFQEAKLILESLAKEQKHEGTPRHLQFDLRIRRHRYILKLCRKLEWTREDQLTGTAVNMHLLYKWLMSPKSPVNKCLMDLKDEELNQIIEALEQLLIL